MKFTLIHPSRSRPSKSAETMDKWVISQRTSLEIIVSIDYDDTDLAEYQSIYHPKYLLIGKSKSAAQAINYAATKSTGDILIVVSDDTECPKAWDFVIEKEVEGKTDWILKTQDKIQPWIITMPIMDRAYYNRTGYIYHPDFEHMFCDTWLTVQADISGRKLTSNIVFPHLNDSIKDELRNRTNGTWRQGEETFVRLIKTVPIEDLRKITDSAMKNWIRNKAGILV